MKKLLLITLLVLGINAITVAQSDSVQTATIESLAAKIDSLATSQAALESRVGYISSGINRRYDKTDLEEMLPIFVLALVAGFSIAVTYIISTTNYRKTQLKYNTMVKCVEIAGTVPDFFNKAENRKAASMPTGGRVHLVLSLLSCAIGSVFMVVTMAGEMKLISSILCTLVGVAFLVACVILFKQYNRIISENSRIEQ